jgi:hypothetical protein
MVWFQPLNLKCDVRVSKFAFKRFNLCAATTRLKKIFANVSDVIYDTKKKDCNRDCYVQEMAESVFCLNPLGWTPWWGSVVQLLNAVDPQRLKAPPAFKLNLEPESVISWLQNVLSNG